jgi:hypothetical protein
MSAIWPAAGVIAYLLAGVITIGLLDGLSGEDDRGIELGPPLVFGILLAVALWPIWCIVGGVLLTSKVARRHLVGKKWDGE